MKNLYLEIYQSYATKGLKGIYRYLRLSNINYIKQVVEFGLEGNRIAESEKSKFLEQPLCFHYYSVGIKSRRNSFTYNRLRGIKIILICK